MSDTNNRTIIHLIAPAVIIGLVTLATSLMGDRVLGIVLCVSIVVLYTVLVSLPQISTLLTKMNTDKLNSKLAVTKAQNPPPPTFKELDLFDAQHDLIHVARDTSVKTLQLVPAFNTIIPSNLPLGSQMPALANLDSEYYQLLVTLHDIFRLVLPNDEKIWVAIRDRRSDDHYHTWMRHGSFNKSRADTSQPMHKDNHNTIRQLKRYYDLQKQCVKITGTSDPDWEIHDNDDLAEDKSVLMGAVMTRSWDLSDKKWINNCLSLVVTVNSPTEDIFDSSHIPLMQGAIDSFSWLTNTTMRLQHQNNRTRGHLGVRSNG